MMESKHIISSICFKLNNENIQLVSFNGQSVTFRLSIKEIKNMNIYNISVFILSYNYKYKSIFTFIKIIWNIIIGVQILEYNYNYKYLIYINAKDINKINITL